jgi:hypothetical protein
MRLQEISRWPEGGRGSCHLEAHAHGSWKKSIVTRSAAPYSSPMRNILLIILILLLIGAFPGWGYSSGWGYYPFGGLGLVLLIVLILALTGRL